MRAYSTPEMMLCHIAIPAQHLKIFGVFMLDYPSPPIAARALRAVAFPIIGDVIYCQKWQTGFLTANTLSAVVPQHLDTSRCILFIDSSLPTFFVFRLCHPCFLSRRTFAAMGVFPALLSAAAQPSLIARAVSNAQEKNNV